MFTLDISHNSTGLLVFCKENSVVIPGCNIYASLNSLKTTSPHIPQCLMDVLNEISILDINNWKINKGIKIRISSNKSWHAIELTNNDLRVGFVSNSSPETLVINLNRQIKEAEREFLLTYESYHFRVNEHKIYYYDESSEVLSHLINEFQPIDINKYIKDIDINGLKENIDLIKITEDLGFVTVDANSEPSSEIKKLPMDQMIANFPDKGNVPNGTTVMVQMDIETLRAIKQAMGI